MNGDGFHIELDPAAVRRALGPEGPMGPRGKALVEGAARILRNQIVGRMERAAPRTGRRYRIPGTGAFYTASAPGEPPAVREAAYRDSWDVVGPIVDGSRIVAMAVSSLRTESGHLIGTLLEFGHGPTRPRPHIRPAIMTSREEIRRWIRRFER